MNAAFSAATEQKWKIYILLKTERTSFIPLNLTTELLHVSIEAKGGGGDTWYGTVPNPIIEQKNAPSIAFPTVANA